MQRAHVLGGRSAEGERHHRDRPLDEQVELAPVAVVVVRRSTQLHTEPVGVAGQFPGVVGDRGRVTCRAGGEDVDPESSAADAPGEVVDVLGQVGRAAVAGSQEAEGAGAGHGLGQRRGRRPAGHRRLDEGQAEFVEDHPAQPRSVVHSGPAQPGPSG